MAEKCQHLEVSVQNILYRRESRYEPAEWIEIITCCECGAQLDQTQTDESTIFHVVKGKGYQ
jgi:hypothetical protein